MVVFVPVTTAGERSPLANLLKILSQMDSLWSLLEKSSFEEIFYCESAID